MKPIIDAETVEEIKSILAEYNKQWNKEYENNSESEKLYNKAVDLLHEKLKNKQLVVVYSLDKVEVETIIGRFAWDTSKDLNKIILEEINANEDTSKESVIMEKSELRGKILIVPDIHGRTFWYKARELINEVDRVVFLGDYLDPYSYEGITKEQAIENFKEILKFKEEYDDKVILLIGNHDEIYRTDLKLKCSRYDYTNSAKIRELFKENEDKFQLWYKKGTYLFTHAGITNEWLHNYFNNCNIDQFLERSEEEVVPYLWIVGLIRGGDSYSGSILWHDVKERDLEPTYFQIFGHTQLLSKPIIKENWACLDVRRCFLLDTKTGEITNAE